MVNRRISLSIGFRCRCFYGIHIFPDNRCDYFRYFQQIKSIHWHRPTIKWAKNCWALWAAHHQQLAQHTHWCPFLFVLALFDTQDNFSFTTRRKRNQCNRFQRKQQKIRIKHEHIYAYIHHKNNNKNSKSIEGAEFFLLKQKSADCKFEEKKKNKLLFYTIISRIFCFILCRWVELSFVHCIYSLHIFFVLFCSVRFCWFDLGCVCVCVCLLLGENALVCVRAFILISATSCWTRTHTRTHT